MNDFADEARYLRQRHAYPPARRRDSAVVVLGGAGEPDLARYLAAGAAAMGVPLAAADYHGDYARHWFLGPIPYMVEQVNADTRYECLDAEPSPFEIAALLEGKGNAWIVVIANDPARARLALSGLDGAGIRAPVLLAMTAKAGLVVDRSPSPDIALLRLAAFGGACVAAGPREMAIAAGGLVLNELTQGRERADDDMARPRLVGAYCLRRPLRVADVADGEGLRSLVREISQPPGPAASFHGRSLVIVGAGALANWAVIPMVMDGATRLRIHDGDPEVAAHNLNRQILLARGVGRGAKVSVLTTELKEMAPDGTYEAVPDFVSEPEDATGLENADALVAMPDNDAARTVCGEAALAAHLTYATAGSSAVGAQAVLCRAGVSCYRCVSGRREATHDAAAGDLAGEHSCSLAQEDSVVASNMVAAGLLVSELREALAGRRTANVRFCGDSAQGNRLHRMINPSGPCTHSRLGLLNGLAGASPT